MLPTPEQMKHLRLVLINEDAHRAATVLAQLGVLHPQSAQAQEDGFTDFPAQEFQDVLNRIQTRYRKIIDVFAERGKDAGIETALATVTGEAGAMLDELPALDYLNRIEDRLKAVWTQVSIIEERLRQTRDRRAGTNQLLASLRRFHALDMDLSRVGHVSRFLNVVTGTVANSNSARLSNALALLGCLLEVYYRADNLDYVIIAGPADASAEVDELLKSADFRELELPREFSSRPAQVRQQLDQQARELDQRMDNCRVNLQRVIGEQRALLAEVNRLLQATMPYAALAGYLTGSRMLRALQGWVPASRQREIERALHDRLAYPFRLDFTDPTREQYATVPTKLGDSPLVAPFQALVRQYGLPQYGEFDPGLLFALSYTLMFGMMFGDVGHGAVIVGLSLLLLRRSRVFAVVGALAGLSSVGFGFVYGSLFGYEHILHPLWMSPMQDPQRVLLLALYWGIGFLVIANLLAIRNLLVFGDYETALFSPRGVAGLVFYLLTVYSLIRLFESAHGLPDWSPVLLVVLAGIMLSHQWKQASGPLYERVLVVFIEGFEFLVNNISATLSFLRVAAFALNHVALAAAVFALAGMLDTVGNTITLVLGNLFIIVLEGAIVAIQCLRLEYYEGFSRFFSGKGKPFAPVKIDSL